MSSFEDAASARPIRTAVVGYGLSGRVFHSPFIEDDHNFELAAIVTGNEERASLAAKQHPSAQICRDFGELNALNASVDLVVLAGPPDSHRDLALTALAMGSAVIVDKPFVPSMNDARLIRDAADKAGRPVMVFQNRRWDGDFLTVRSLVEEGRLGEVFHFESAFEHWAPDATDGWKDQLPASEGGGVAWDLGSHLVDQAIQLFGPVASIGARLRTVRRGGGNDDHSEIHLEHKSGVVSRLLMSRVSHPTAPRFRVLGSRGSFVSYGLDPQEPSLDAGARPTDEGFGDVSPDDYGTLVEQTATGTVSTRIPTLTGDYAEFYRRASGTIRGTGPEPVPLAQALEVVTVLETAVAAAAAPATSSS